jgi:hypothetical protein
VKALLEEDHYQCDDERAIQFERYRIGHGAKLQEIGSKQAPELQKSLAAEGY